MCLVLMEVFVIKHTEPKSLAIPAWTMHYPQPLPTCLFLPRTKMHLEYRAFSDESRTHEVVGYSISISPYKVEGLLSIRVQIYHTHDLVTPCH